MKDRHPDYPFVPLSSFDKLVKSGHDPDDLDTLLMSIAMTGSKTPSQAPGLKDFEDAGLIEPAIITASQWLQSSKSTSSDAAESIGFITHWNHGLGSLICCRVVRETVLRLVKTTSLPFFSECKTDAIDSAKGSRRPKDAIRRTESLFRELRNWKDAPSGIASSAIDIAYASANGVVDKHMVYEAMTWMSSLATAAGCAKSKASKERRLNVKRSAETPKDFKVFHKFAARQYAAESLLQLLGVCSGYDDYSAYSVIRSAQSAYSDGILSDGIDSLGRLSSDELSSKMEHSYNTAFSKFEAIARRIAAETCEDFLLRDKTQDELDDEVSYAATLPSRGASSRSAAAPLLIGAAAGAAALAVIKKAKS